MIHTLHHLTDDDLTDAYFAARAGDAPVPLTAEHLADCAECADRYGSMATLLDNLRTDADEAVDAAFPAEALRAQQAAIARRLELVGRSAQVIAFPGQKATAAAPRTSHPIARRWVAAAAAAGLFVGLGTGWLVRDGRSTPSHSATALARPAAVSAGTVRVLPTAVEPDDDAFMSELELAADRPRTRELMPFDALTPHVREVATTGR